MFTVLTLATQILSNFNVIAQTLEQANNFGSHQNHIKQLRIPGDLIIGGVFPVHAKGPQGGGPCGEISETRGVHRVEAMLYALDIINSQPDFLRGYKLGALILDSCSNPSYALNQSLDFVRDMIGSTDSSEYQCGDGSQPALRNTPKKKVVAVVGASYSSVTVQIANLLRLFRIVQVSPASTNADLSDKSRFEFFARTVPSDTYQARAMGEIAAKFNWTYVSLVYSADEYGELGADAFKREARKLNICIAAEERLSINDLSSIKESVGNLVKKLQPDKDVGARVVVLFVGTEYIPILMQTTANEIKQYGLNKKNIIWLASESWDRNNEAYTSGARRLAAEGAIVLMLESQRVPSFENYYLSLYPGQEKFERNKWLRELWRRKFNCEFDLPEDTTINRCEAQRESRESFTPDDKIQFVIEAVFAIAHGLQEMKNEHCKQDTIETSWISRHSGYPQICAAMRHIDGADFYTKYLLNVTFSDLVGRQVHFSPEGDGPAHYTILNYQPDRQNKVGSRTSSDYVEVGSWSERKLEIDHNAMFWAAEEGGKIPISQCSMPCPVGYKKQLIKSDEVCCWACGKCEDYEYLINDTTCMDCGQGRWPKPDRKSCFDLKDRHLRYMRWNSYYSIVPCIFAVIGITVTLFVIACYAIYNDTPVVKASGRELSYILLISLIMCYSMTFVLISPPTTFACAVKRTGIGFAFSVLYSALLVKTNRVHRIFASATRSAKRPACISPSSQIVLTCILAGVQLIGSIFWLFIVPAGTRIDHPTRDQVVLTCNVPDHHFLYSLAYDGALLITCTVFAVMTRKVPENFNETKFVGFSMYTTCVIWVSWIAFFFGTANNFEIQTTSLCISISMSANVVLACIFSPKLWIIFFEKHKNKPEGFENSVHKKWNSNYNSIARHNTVNHSNNASNHRDTSNTSTEKEDPDIYTGLLSNQRRRSSRKQSEKDSTSTINAHDTFL
ncbi:unnamed protein product [Bursaphelenchus xylophilus]|uniref:(pine wood nematode) hypothetical protein n=1 Tax=Bursaphelenchus xylophilus TaxID=6326 RepID=A0A1I7S9H4_BURXY|nr:unnamed protein product [Bursaphelenchus xylophilus]CAG9111118.1 unnamed protein product [Bursaphelenchus xylophilus]